MNLQLMEVCGPGDAPVQLTFLVSRQQSLLPTVWHPVATPPAPAAVPSCPRHGRGMWTDRGASLMHQGLEIQGSFGVWIPQSVLSPE